ncbi:maker53 [Drosophila busckii]|uniref:Maker53 n=1 Tax=Drosophila busckii TaxID=30019 RepID=A0A0M4EG05_DROBS|nr:maker53 [Drosophila busckii]
MELKFYQRLNGYRPWFPDANFDFCELIRSDYNPLGKIFYASFKKFSNMNHSCPFTDSLIVDNAYADYSTLVLPIFPGHYMFKLVNYFAKKPQLNISVYFSVIEDWKNV